jgi:hypothetical protein
MVELLFALKEAYGYQLYEHYIRVFPKVTRRLIYYHLAKGVESGEIEPLETRKEEGDYTWGSMAEKIYYKVGSKARPRGDLRVERYVEEMISLAYEKRQQRSDEEAKKQDPSL